MTVYKPAKSPYYHYDFQFRGVRYTQSTGCTDKATAKRVEAEARRDAALPQRTRPPITLDEAAGFYADKFDNADPGRDGKRILTAMLTVLPRRTQLASVTQRDLIHAIAKRRNGRSNASVNREVEIWRAVWRYADAARYDIGDMPAWSKLMLKVETKAARTLSRVEEAALFANLRADLHPFVRFALMTGWRLSEVRKLTWREVDLGGRTARMRIKGGDTVESALTTAMVALLASQPRVCPQVFTVEAHATRSAHVAKDGRKRAARRKGERYPISADGWRGPWQDALTAAGIDGLRFHDLRHTRGTRMTATGAPLNVTMKALRHKSIKTTLRYSHADNQDVRDGLEASELAVDARGIIPHKRREG